MSVIFFAPQDILNFKPNLMMTICKPCVLGQSYMGSAETAEPPG